MSTNSGTYTIAVQGHIDEHWASWLGDLSVTHHDDGTTTLTGPIPDQAALHGVLTKLRDLGIPLIAVGPTSS